jgi:hypothetical protein
MQMLINAPIAFFKLNMIPSDKLAAALQSYYLTLES